MSFQKQKHLEWEEGSAVGQRGETKKWGVFSLLRQLCFWKVSLTQKSPSTHLLHTLRVISSLAAHLQGEENVQLLFASGNSLGELHSRVQQGRVQHSTQNNTLRPCPVALLSLVPPQG